MSSTVEQLRLSQQVRELSTTVPGASTDELLHRLLDNLTALLSARRAYVTQVINEERSRTIASWEDGKRGPVREYTVAGTPCQTVLRHGVHVVDCALGDRYSLAEGSLGYECESFIGCPVTDHAGNRIGQLCVFGPDPLDDPEMASALVSLAAVRVSAELEHRQHEDALRRQRRQLEVLLGNLPGMVYRCDADELRRLQFVSDGCRSLIGFDDSEMLGEVMYWSALVHERDQQRVWDEVQRALADGGSFEVQYRIVTGNGAQKWVWERGCGIYDSDGNVSYIEGFVSDATKLKESEESLKAVERRFRAVFDQRQWGAGILSTAGVLLEANQTSLDFAGLDRSDVVGRELWDTPWWRHSPELQERMRVAVQSAAAGDAVSFQASCVRADGNLAALDFSVRPIIDRTGKVEFLVTESHDITEHKRAEEEARQHRERIAHVTRLSTLGEMAAGIAHEINQPLTAISLFAQAGKRLVDAGNLEKMDEVCQKLNEHALRAAEVVERMQTMARQGESVKEVVSCNDLIESAVKLAESEARIHDFQIEFDKCSDCSPVSADAVQIQQVALNLLRNGMEAMLTVDDGREKRISIRTRKRRGSWIEVSVTDNGPGVPEDRVDKMFTPFSTTKKSGMGMGLSISQAIVRAHGGEIDFRNNDSGGATFWFTLPVSTREAQDG